MGGSNTLNTINSAVHIGPNVKLGNNNIIGFGVVIEGDVTIGDNNHIRPFTVIGTPPEKHGFFKTHGKVIIGNNNEISEHVTIHSSAGDMPTEIGNNCILMTKVHIGHDAKIMDNVTISSAAIIGGHCIIMRFANIGLNATIHQNVVIGSCAMIGAGAFVGKKTHISPGNIYSGVPAKFLKRNEIGIMRSGISQEDLQKDVVHYGRLIGVTV